MPSSRPDIAFSLLLSAFFFGMQAAAGLLVMINFRSISLASPELILMIVMTCVAALWEAMRKRFLAKQAQDASMTL